MLFRHYMYGYEPPLPKNLTVRVAAEDRAYLSGAATRRVLSLRFGPRRAGELTLTLVTPNGRKGPAPCFFGLNLDEAAFAERTIRRGYAFATFRKEEVASDSPDYDLGVYPLYYRRGQRRPGPHEWGALSAWAWGLGIAARALASAPWIDPARVAVVGHSRMGKAAILAGALYPSIALVVAHQSGTGGAAPNRVAADGDAESVANLVDNYPHWFSSAFASFHDRPDRLPFSQAALIALAAPRPVLLGNAPDGRWTNPEGAFRMLQLADPVYRLLGVSGLGRASAPGPRGSIRGARLGFYVRSSNGHFMDADDWDRFMDFADVRLGVRPENLASAGR
jgi:hypothetical protein